MQYPEISPTAPVSRDDLAHILAMQGLAGTQPGDASSVDIGALFGANTPDYSAGQPSPSSASFTAPGAMTTSMAAMVGEDSMGGGQAVGVPGYGRTGDDTSQSSQDKQSADRAALAEAAVGRGPIDAQTATMSLSDRSMTAPGWGSGMPATPAGYTPDFGRATPNADIAITATGRNAPTGPVDVFSGSHPNFGTPAMTPMGDPFDAFAGAAVTPSGRATPTGWGMPSVADLFDVGKNMVSQGWNAVTAPAMTAPTGRAPATATPTGRAPVGVPVGVPVAPNAPTPTATPGPTDPGGNTFGGFSESAPGGYTSGPSSTEGFGAGYSGSSSMGNTQGATGFTAGDPSGMGSGQGSSDPGSGAVGGFSGSDAGSGPGSGADPGGSVG